MIEVTDPWNPPCPTASSGGVKSLMTGSNWYANYWYSPGNIPASKWNGNYVAVVEPPVRARLHHTSEIFHIFCTFCENKMSLSIDILGILHIS